MVLIMLYTIARIMVQKEFDDMINLIGEVVMKMEEAEVKVKVE